MISMVVGVMMLLKLQTEIISVMVTVVIVNTHQTLYRVNE